MKTDDLILAAHVRELAAELRQEHAFSTKKEMDARIPAEQRESMEDYLAKYRTAHPISKFVPEALQKLEKVSEVIEDYLKSSHKK